MSERPATCPRCGSRLTSGSPLDDLCPRCLVLLAVEPREEVAAIDAPGTRFGAYRLLEQVGEGGMGIVWRAQQDHPVRRVVALKVVKPGADSRQGPRPHSPAPDRSSHEAPSAGRGSRAARDRR